MSAPDLDDFDEGEGSQRVSSKLLSHLHHGSVHAAAGGEDGMATSAYSILACSHQGQSLHPGMQAPAGPATASGRKGATFLVGESGGGGQR